MSNCWKLPPCPTEVVLDDSGTNLPLGRAEPVTDGSNDTSGIF